MTTILQGIERNMKRIAQGGGSSVPNSEPQTPSILPDPPDQIPSLPNRGPWPSQFSLNTDFTQYSATFQKNTVRSRTFPVPPNTNTQKTTTIVQAASIAPSASIEFETNNSPNPNQTKLNLLAGTDITLKSDVNGGVTITASGSGFEPNLAIGDVFVNWPQTDPASVIIVDDFMGAAGATSIAVSPTNGSIGTLPWVSPNAFNTTGLGLVAGSFPNLGWMVWENNTVASTAYGLFPATTAGSDGTNGASWALFDVTGWKLTWIFKWDNDRAATAPFSTAKKAFYIGLVGSSYWNAMATPVSRPDVFFGLRFDTSATSPSISDSFFTFEAVVNSTFSTFARHNTQGTTKVTNVAPVAGVTHRLDITCTVLGVITMTLDGSATNSLTVTVSQLVSSPTGTSLTGSAANNVATFVVGTTSSGWASPQFAVGSKITVAGFTGPTAALNGPQVIDRILGSGAFPQIHCNISTASVTSQSTAGSITGYPGVVPCISFGNDDTAAPTENTSIWIDRFEFVYNPQLAADFSATADPTKSRYFAAQV